MIELERFSSSFYKKSFVNRIFSKEEIAYFEKKANPLESAAANFCAKEAFSKAIGTGITGYNFNDVMVLHNDLGAPYLKLKGNAEKKAQELGFSFSVSLTHTAHYASAVVVAFKGEE